MQDSEISPAERRRLRVRGAILDAAEKVFAEEGEAGLSIRRIADEIDYSPAAIYKYFSSKDDLVDVLKESFFGRLLGTVHEIIDRREPFSARARRCMAGYVRIAIEKPHHYVAAFTGVRADDEAPSDAQAFDDTNKGRAFSVLTDMVSEGIEGGHFRPELDTVNTAKSVWASIHGLAMMIAHLPDFPATASMPGGMSQAEFIDFHADLIVRSLEKQSGVAA
ncbi:TetR/AcrR family transcriptional regulator [Henriciella marina]|uniref:TetR/AcrR family transcriptional regulator n=1 Tax=Henriciella marina TaxID=453851 RepID=A0ABT4M0L1_9PROT|nr:TetR/AcrR family transcriptional regulator [Henriciella marina]MCZ4299328.1 TetR/AcrR family transcriptional regulator [Henriciella marina]